MLADHVPVELLGGPGEAREKDAHVDAVGVHVHQGPVGAVYADYLTAGERRQSRLAGGRLLALWRLGVLLAAVDVPVDDPSTDLHGTILLDSQIGLLHDVVVRHFVGWPLQDD